MIVIIPEPKPVPAFMCILYPAHWLIFQSLEESMSVVVPPPVACQSLAFSACLYWYSIPNVSAS